MKNNKLAIILNGFIKENPVLVLVLGTCPTLAVSTSIISALAMGVSATLVLLGSNLVISLLRKIIPDQVRIPCYIVIIAGFVTVVQMLLQAYLPELYEMLGVYLALIVVNCIILGRAEMYASKNKPLDSVCDAIGMGIGFMLAVENKDVQTVLDKLNEKYQVDIGENRSLKLADNIYYEVEHGKWDDEPKDSEKRTEIVTLVDCL